MCVFRHELISSKGVRYRGVRMQGKTNQGLLKYDITLNDRKCEKGGGVKIPLNSLISYLNRPKEGPGTGP